MREGETPAAEDFRVKLDGIDARLLRVRGPKDPMLLIIVLDLTGDLALAATGKDAAVAALRALPPKDYVAVMRAQDGLRVLVDPTLDREAAAQAVASLPVSGKAGFLESVEAACRLADAIAGKTGPRVALLYLTDSNIHNYREDFTNPVINSSDSRDLSRSFPEGLVREKISKLEKTLAATPAPLFVVHLDYRTDRLNEAYQTGLLQLTSSTGGWAAFCRSVSEIPGAISRGFEAVVSHWSLEVALPPGRGRTVTAVVENGSRVMNYRSRFEIKR